MGIYHDWSEFLVKAITLDSLIDAADVIKIDVEGHASHVLDGMSHLLEAKPDLLIEDEPNLIERLERLGYAIERLDERNLYATVLVA